VIERRLQDALLVGNLDGEMRRHRVGELGIVVDLLDHADDLGRNLLVELHIVLELGDHRARERLRFDPFAGVVGKHGGFGLEILGAVGVALDLGARRALDQHFDSAVGELEQLQHARERAGLEDRSRRRIVIVGILLRRKQDECVRSHHLLEREDRLLASDEQRRDHVRKDHDVAERQHRIGSCFTWRKRWVWLCSGHGPKSVLLSFSAATRLCAATTECRWAGKGIRAAARYPKGRYDALCPFSRPHQTSSAP